MMMNIFITIVIINIYEMLIHDKIKNLNKPVKHASSVFAYIYHYITLYNIT